MRIESVTGSGVRVLLGALFLAAAAPHVDGQRVAGSRSPGQGASTAGPSPERGSLGAAGGDGLVQLDFDTEDDFATPLVNGQAVASPPLFGRLVAIHGFGPHTYGAAIFDSTPDGPNALGADRDLLVGRGNVLILQESQLESAPGIYADPDDAQLGGTLAFDFPQPVELVSVDLIDICPGSPTQDVTLTLVDRARRTRTFHVPGGWTGDLVVDGPVAVGTLDLRTLAPQPGFVATATATQVPGFVATDVERFEVRFESSGALDALVFDPQFEEVTLTPVRDNTLIQTSTGSLSNGAGPSFRAGRVGPMGGGTRRRGVLAFDVAGTLPAGATVRSATLRLELFTTMSEAQDVSLHALAADWGEGSSSTGGGLGAPSTPGDATWLHRFYPDAFWATPGGDFAAAPSATASVAGAATLWSSAEMAADVQRWLDDPAADFGWLLLGDESSVSTVKAFWSRESDVATRRPRLTVRYSPPTADVRLARDGAAPGAR